MTTFKKRLEKELERRRNTWFPCKSWQYTDPETVAREIKARDERAALKNAKLTAYLAKQTAPVEKIRAIVEKRNCPNCKYFGQSPSYGKRFIVKITLLNGVEIPCAIPFSADQGFINLGFIHEIGGFDVAKWVDHIEIDYVWYDFRGYHWSQVDGIPHEEKGVVIRRHELT